MRPRISSNREPAFGQDGSAALEFIVAGMVLLVPIVYMIVALGQIQSHAFGVETAARQAARVIATSTDSQTADAATRRIMAAVAIEYGIDPGDVEVSVDCSPDARVCPEAGAIVKVTVGARAPLPLVPPVLGMDDIASVSVEATSSQKVSRSWTG
jgi:Flp pilus assembly protein TadG